MQRTVAAMASAFACAICWTVFSIVPAQAELFVSGTATAVEIVAKNAALDEVFDALHTRFGLRYRMPPDLGRRVSGRFVGNLRQVVTRMLDGQNFVISTKNEGKLLEVIVLDSMDSPAAGSASAPTAAPRIIRLPSFPPKRKKAE